MKSTVCFLAACLSLYALPALAAKACYNPAQLHAEQLLRLHSELMVITVTCRQGSEGQDLGAAYTDFTKRNIRVLHDAEQEMIAYYKANDRGDPVDHLDRLRTRLGNEFGQKDADMGAPEFCGQYRDKVLQFDSATPADVENEISLMEVSDHSYVNACKIPSATVAGKN